ncbi:c-type cytochrome [Variovorax sp. H27-G14]|uniref:c-type cytochrome n=1 Tax=Variovorax sp. H27-G14 TaxID=3111914 RepID=UPI0038FC5A7A
MNIARAWAAVLLVLGGAIGSGFGSVAMAQNAPGSATVSASGSPPAALIDKGRQLAIAADCMACHTAPASLGLPGGGKPFAGGYAIESPLGAIYATNITPSKVAGIGDYTEAEFARALRQGVRRDGSHLYPAMPYTSYTQLSDDDTGALYAYFMHGVAAVDADAEKTELPFPFSQRWSMAIWNLLFLDNQRFVPDATKSAEWNRGAYLAGALGHCSACHTPRNALMAERGGQALAGGAVGPWYAPNITSDPVSGIGAWSEQELVQYLRTGRVEGKAQAAGGMAEAVQNSLQHLPEPDLRAIAVYLKGTPPIRDKADTGAGVGADGKPAHAWGAASSTEATLRGSQPFNSVARLNSGEHLYNGYCASCHQSNGAGSRNQAYPSLFHNTATGLSNPANLVAAILYGVDRQVGDTHVLMPRFDTLSYVDPLTDVQIADIANYVLGRYGNGSAHVSEADVALARAGGPRPLLAQVQPYILPAMGVAVLLLIWLMGAWWARRRRAKPAG